MNTREQYHCYEVVKPLTVKKGIAIPWFDYCGLGTQYETDVSIEQLIKDGVLRPMDLPFPRQSQNREVKEHE